MLQPIGISQFFSTPTPQISRMQSSSNPAPSTTQLYKTFRVRRSHPPLNTLDLSSIDDQTLRKVFRTTSTKRVRHLICNSGDLIHLFRYLRPNLQRLSIDPESAPNDTTKDLHGFRLFSFGSEEPPCRKDYKRLTPCKHLLGFQVHKITECQILGDLRLMKSLQALTLSIRDTQLPYHLAVFNHLSHIQQAKLTILRHENNFDELPSTPCYCRFFRHLLTKSSLHTLEVDLRESMISEDIKSFETVLDYIDKSKVEYFKVYVTTNFNEELDLSKFDRLLSQAEFLAIRISNFIFDIRIAKVMLDSKKIFWICMKEGALVDLAALVSKCVSLKSLCAQYISERPIHADSFSFPKSLKHIFVTFDISSKLQSNILEDFLLKSLRKMESVETFGYTMPEINEYDLKKLTEFHQALRGKGLKTYLMSIIAANQKGRPVSQTTLETVTGQIGDMDTLENLKFNFSVDKAISLDCVERMLGRLKGLKGLDAMVNLFGRTETVALRFPFAKLPRMESLKIELLLPFTEEYTILFVKSLLELKELRAVELLGKVLGNIDASTMVMLAKGLGKLEKLKHVKINIKRRITSVGECLEYARQLKIVDKSV